MQAVWCFNAKENVFRMNVIHINNTVFRNGQLPGTFVDFKVFCYCLVANYSEKYMKDKRLHVDSLLGVTQIVSSLYNYRSLKVF